MGHITVRHQSYYKGRTKMLHPNYCCTKDKNGKNTEVRATGGSVGLAYLHFICTVFTENRRHPGKMSEAAWHICIRFTLSLQKLFIRHLITQHARKDYHS